MVSQSRVTRNALTNLNSNHVGQKWRQRFESMKRNFNNEKIKSYKKQDQNQKLKERLKSQEEQLETERKLRNSAERKNEVLERKLLSLEQKLLETNERFQQLTVRFDSAVNTSSSLNSELHLLTEELELKKRAELLQSLEKKENAKQRENEQKDHKKENAKLISELKRTEERESKKVEPLGHYSASQTAYRQHGAVKRCVDFLKSGAPNANDYYHLVKNIVMFPAFSDSFPLQLTPEATFILRSTLHLSDSSMKKMKKMFHDRLGFDVLASRHSVSEMRRTLDRSQNYNVDIVEKEKVHENGKKEKVETIKITIKDLELGIRERLENLERHNLLIEVQDSVTLSLLGDKGSDETKLCVSIENVQNPNSPHNLMPVGIYEGQDNMKELKENFAEVFKMWDDLQTITFQSATGGMLTKKIQKKIIGDYKFQYAICGHMGQSSEYPCHYCYHRWSSRGSHKILLGDADFSVQPVMRTLDSYCEDSKKGDFSVVKGSKMLCATEPSDLSIPTVHTLMGIFETYFQRYINAQLNSMDRKDKSASKTLKEQTKELSKLVKDEKEAKQFLDTLIRAQEEAYCSATSYRIVLRNPVMHLKHPEPLCEAELCIINHLSKDRDNDDWIRCDLCRKYFHFSCCSLFSPEQKLEASHLKTWICNVCNGISSSEHLNAAATANTALISDVQKSRDQYEELTRKRQHLESIMFLSTGDNRKKMEKLMEKIGCCQKTWYQTYTGNQVRIILRKENIDAIFSILPDTEENGNVKEAMYTLAEIMSCSDALSYTDEEIDVVERIVKKFLEDMKIAFPKETITPKLHTLAYHLIPYMRAHHSWGRTSEQGIESFHCQYNILKNVFRTVRNLHLRAVLILQELTTKNWLHDSGVWAE